MWICHKTVDTIIQIVISHMYDLHAESVKIMPDPLTPSTSYTLSAMGVIYSSTKLLFIIIDIVPLNHFNRGPTSHPAENKSLIFKAISTAMTSVFSTICYVETILSNATIDFKTIPADCRNNITHTATLLCHVCQQ